MSSRKLESLDRFGEEKPRKSERRRSSTSSSKKTIKEEKQSSKSSRESSLKGTPTWGQGLYVPGVQEETSVTMGHATPERPASPPAPPQEVMPSHTSLGAPPEKSFTLKEEDNLLEENIVNVFLEVMPNRDRDFAKQMLQRANNNVEQALCLAFEEEHVEENHSPQEVTSYQRPSPPRHQPSLTMTDVQPSSNHFMDTDSESMRFLAEFADEVPSFRPPSPGSPTKQDSQKVVRTHSPRLHSPSRTQMGAQKSSMKQPKYTNPNTSSTPLPFSNINDTMPRRPSNSSVPMGASNNLDAVREMARVATATKQASMKQAHGEEAQVKRTSGVHVGWNESLFVVGEKSSPTQSPSSSSPDPSPERKKSIDAMLHASMPSLGLSSSSDSITPNHPLAVKRKNTLIVDKKKRDTRWQWAQTLVSKTFKPYRQMLSEKDDLLPDKDEFEAFEASGANADKEFESVRDVMLDDVDLTEREVAAFFEGFALFNVKIQSLQSQLESLKAVSRAAEPRSVVSRHRSFSAFPQTQSTNAIISGEGVDAFSKKNSGISSKVTFNEPKDDKDSSRMLGESLRALSIKKVQTQHDSNEEVQRLLRELEEADKKQKKLEKQLKQAGVIIAEDIPYEEAKSEVERIAKRMGEIGSSEVTHPDKEEQARLREEYFKLEQEMEKYNAALMLTDEYIEEQEEAEQKWEDDYLEENMEALKKLRRHMPVNVKSMSEADLSSKPSPNGKILPKTIAKKFKRTNVLQLIRTDPEDLVRMHPSTLENLRVTGLTLTERRAIYAHIKDVGPRWKAMQADKMTERKWTWFKMMKQNFKENLDIYDYHVRQYGPPGNHPYATRDKPNEGCPLLGKQCPLKGDKQIDYDNDYGYTDAAEYEVSNVRKSDKEDPGAKAKREAMELARDKKANERSVELKKHYKGKLLQVSLANGSCESMDEIMDKIEMLQTKWIEERLSNEGEEVTDDGKRKELAVFTEALNELKLGVLHLAERSGMQLTGKKDANADQPDKRSAIELGLCEEVYESCVDFFASIEERMKEIKAKDGRLNSTIEQLHELLEELHDRNVATLKDLECKRPAPSRKHKTHKDLLKEAKAKMISESTAVEERAGEEYDLPPGAGDRGGLMAVIAGRGGAPVGRGDLMSAIAGRGRGGAPGGRGDLMSAIAGRGRGGARGGRGDLMSAIAGRGRAGPGRGDLMSAIKGRGDAAGQRDAGGSGDLMSAIKGRGRVGDSGRGNAGGRGDLLSAIAGLGKVEKNVIP